MALIKHYFCWSNKTVGQADFLHMEWTISYVRGVWVYVTIGFRGGNGKVQECTMYKYKLMSGFIVHCNIKSMYYTQLFCQGIMDTEASKQKWLMSE